jgi:RNA polymerase sigma factor (sigma-70 family)
MVYALCRLILRDRVEAEDAAQQTFLSAYRSLLNGRGPEQPEAWLATIARNECRNRIARRPPSTVELIEADGQAAPDPSGLIDSRAEIEALCAAVAELPEKQREAIVLREFYGLSYREVAAALGTTGTAVESALFKSRRSLQERLRPIRDAAASLTLPLSIKDSLSQLIPGFSPAAAGGGGVALAAKLGVPVGVKALVAGLSVVAIGGTLAVEHSPRHHVHRAVSPAPATSQVKPARLVAATMAPRMHVARSPVTRATRIAVVAARPATPHLAAPVHHTVATIAHRSTRKVQQPQATKAKAGAPRSQSNAQHSRPAHPTPASANHAKSAAPRKSKVAPGGIEPPRVASKATALSAELRGPKPQSSPSRRGQSGDGSIDVGNRKIEVQLDAPGVAVHRDVGQGGDHQVSGVVDVNHDARVPDLPAKPR